MSADENTKRHRKHRLREVPEPVVGPEEVKIEVKAAGICGTDIHIYHIYYDEFPSEPPCILGHEFSGQVVEVGKNVENSKVGHRVTSETSG
ncbi:MAG: alcohol dehydrogenase catalytic domain-containing protein [Deltaproteobacteria bacterium]|nr:alcohol dehydrogenase catalytic domain-containing protein [Deltaproteobacteria bacterium]